MLLGEILLFTFLPLIFWGLHEFINKKYNKKYLLVIGASLLILSHIISVLYTAIFCIIFIIIYFEHFFTKKGLLNLGLCILVIILLTIFFTFPLLIHQSSDIYKISNLDFDAATYVAHPAQLISAPIVFSDASAYHDSRNEMNYLIGTVLIVLFIMGPMFIKKIKANGDLKLYITFSILSIISILMAILPDIWNKISILDMIQYPWRLIGFTEFFMSIVACIVLKCFVTNSNFSYILLLSTAVSLVSIITFTLQAQPDAYDLNYYNYEKQTVIKMSGINVLGSSLGFYHEYLPNVTQEDYIFYRGTNIYNISNKLESSTKFTKKNKYFTATIKNSNHITKIELPFIFYYGYDIKLNGQKVPYDISKNGFIQLEIPASFKGTITLYYKGYPIANIISLITGISCIIYIIIYNKKHPKKYLIATTN